MICRLLLSDKGSKTINEYGIHNQNGFAHPGTCLIDGNGVVRADFFLESFSDRHSNADLIKAEEELK